MPALLRFIALLATLLAPHAKAAEVQVAVAANFAAPLARIAEGFTSSTGHTVRVSSGSTGKFQTQIRSGAPFDLLLAADRETPSALVADGYAVKGSQFTYASGRLVLWSASAGLIDPQGAVLRSDRIRHLAVANPRLAPYGTAAFEVLQALGLRDALAPRLVLGESIAQAYQFVATGNAEAGFVALSQVAVPGKPVSGSYWRVPENLYRPIRQDAVLLSRAAGNPAAVALLAYLKGDAAKQVIAAYGYGN